MWSAPGLEVVELVMAGGLVSMLRSIKARDPAARSLLEIALLYPGIRAMAFYRVAHALWGLRLSFLARLVSEIGRWLSGIEIHPGATIGKRFFIDHGTGVVIGETAIIGDDVTMYHGVTLGGVSTAQTGLRRHPIVEDKVIIGAGAQVLGPITVGHGARVGANAVAVRDVPPGVTVVGIPAQEALPRGAVQVDNFVPYGSCDDKADPTSRAIMTLLNEVEALRRRITQVESEFREPSTANSWQSNEPRLKKVHDASDLSG
jgi:serine O-acetyltransferase